MTVSRNLVALGLALAAPLAAQATVLTFTETTFGLGGIATYGDRVAGSPQAGAAYGEGLGWTPGVVLNFDTLGKGPVSQWSSGYASLAGALGHGNFDVPFDLQFTPDAGLQVTLQGFDIATWLGASYQTRIRIWDDAGSLDAPNLLNFNALLAPGTVYRPLAGPVTATGTLHLSLSNLGSTGLDNIHFTQAPVPEPQSWLLMGLGLAGLLALRRRAG
jgi:hypothetical protein